MSWALAIAPLQGPDETEHLAYVEHLAETGKIPSATTGTSTYARDEATALASGLLAVFQNRQARPPWSVEAERSFRSGEDQLGVDARKTGEGPNPTAKNPPLYYLYEAAGWNLAVGAGFFGKLFVLRLLSGLLLLAFVVLTWLLAGEVFGGRRLPQTVATGVVALLPMNAYMSGVVNTDILLAVVWALFLWLALRMVRLGLTWKRSAWLSLVTVLCVLTHGRGLALVPALPTALLVAWLVHAKSLRTTLAAVAASALVLVSGLLVYRGIASAGENGGELFGGEINLGNKQAFSVRQLLSSIWQFYLPKLDSMQARLGPPIGYRQIFVQQYFAGVFSLNEVYFPYWVYDTVQVAVFLLIATLWTLAAMRPRSVLAHWPKLVILAVTAGCVLLFLHIASYRALLDGGGNPLITGRYLLPLGAIVGVCAGALVALLPRRLGAAVAVVILVGLVTLSVGALGLTVERFYA
jgi:hypothetical protein